MIYLDSPTPVDPRDVAAQFFADMDRRISNQRIFDAIRRNHHAVESDRFPSRSKVEHHGEGTSEGGAR